MFIWARFDIFGRNIGYTVAGHYLFNVRSGEGRRKSDTIKLEPEDIGGGASSGLSLAIAKFSSSMASDLKGRTHNGGQQQQRTGGGKEEAMLPFVSITPIGKGDAQVTN